MQNNMSLNRSKAAQQAQTVKVRPRWHMTVLHIVYYLIMVVFLVFYMLPFWGTVMTSFKTNSEVMTSTPIMPPTQWTLEGYASAMEELGMPLLTSLVVTIFGAAGSVFLGSICAYALSKWKFRLNNVFFIALVAATYLPFQAILIPLLQTINSLDLYDNVWGLVLVHSVFGMPMCTVMMRGYYADVPDALIRQAMIDGNGVWQIVALVVSLAIMVMGVAGGIEKANKIMMPVLFGLFLVLAIYIGTLPGASAGYKYILTLNPAGLAKPDLWVFAFGQAFFSLSVAGNGSVIYGSYLSKSEDIPSSARNVAVFDTIAALLAAIVIIPAMAVVLGEGINDVKGGPGLMFVYLVNVFNAMPAGRIIGAIFYICVLFAGVSSIVNLYEAPIAFLQEQFKFKRAAAVGTIGVIGLVVSIAIQPWTSQWMDVVSIYICPLGAALAGVMFFWVLGKEKAIAAVNEGAKKPIGGWFFPLGKWVYVICAVLALILGVMYGGIG